MLYQIKDNSISNIPVTLQPSDIVTDFAFYNERFYTLISSKNQIYRHPPVAGGYGSGITWIQDPNYNLRSATSLAIDSAVWVATPDGQVLKLFKGRGADFKMPSIDPKLEKIDKLIHFEGSSFIYLLDKANSRVIAIKDDGSLVTQYFSPMLQNINSIAVDEKSSTLYLADKGTDLYGIIMTHQK